MRQGKIFYTRFGISIFIVIVLVIGMVVGFKAYQKHQARQAQLHFAKAETLYKCKKYQEAVKEYELVATRYPRSEYVPTCWFRQGYIYRFYLSQDTLAQESFAKIIQNYHSSSHRFQALFYLLDVYGRLGRYEDQLATINILLAEFPANLNRDTLHLIAMNALFRLGKKEEAYQEAAAIKDSDAPVVKNNQEYFHLLISKDPSNPKYYFELSRIYKGLGLKRKAEQEFATAQMYKRLAKNPVMAKKVAKLLAKSSEYKLKPAPPPKTRLSKEEEELYFAYKTAVNYSWPNAEIKYAQKLMGPDFKGPETKEQLNQLYEFKTKWWADWGKKHNTTEEYVIKMVDVIRTDIGLEKSLEDKLAKKR